MQICLKSMNSLSGVESTAMLNQDEEGWDAGRWGGKKAGGHQGFAVHQGRPCNSTPSPMEWYFIHPQGPKKDPLLSPPATNSPERGFLTSQPILQRQVFRDRTPLATSEVGGNKTKDKEGTGIVWVPPTLTLLSQ